MTKRQIRDICQKIGKGLQCTGMFALFICGSVDTELTPFFWVAVLMGAVLLLLVTGICTEKYLWRVIIRTLSITSRRNRSRENIKSGYERRQICSETL